MRSSLYRQEERPDIRKGVLIYAELRREIPDSLRLLPLALKSNYS